MNDAKNLHELKQLYSESFINDSPEFIDFFFNEYINNADILTHYEHGELISAGYIIYKPAQVFYNNTIFPFITALATKSEHRGKGKIGNIINQIYSALLSKGYYFLGLHPFNFMYYKKFCFTDICYAKKMTVKGGINFEERAAALTDYHILYELYNEQAKNFDNKFLLSCSRLTNWFNEYKADKCECKILSHDGKDFCFVFEQNGYIDYYATNDLSLFERAENFKNCTYYDYSIPKQPFLQGRIIDAKKALLNYDYDKNINTSVNIKVYDPDIAINNFTAKLVVFEGKAELLPAENAKIDEFFDIRILTDKMFNGDGKLFKKRLNFFSDKY